MRLNKEVREVVQFAKQYGFTLEGRSGSGHIIIRNANGTVTLPSSPGGGRWERNSKAQIRRMAVDK